MLNKIISIIFMAAVLPIQGFALEQMLEVNNQKTSKRFRMIYWVFLGILPGIANVMTNNRISALQNIMYGIGVICPLVMFYLDPIWRRVLAFFVMLIGLTSSDLVIMFIVQFTNLDAAIFYDRTEPLVVFCVGVGSFISIVATALIVIVWKRVFYKGTKVKYFGFFLLYIINHFVSLALMEVEFRSLAVSSSEIWPVLTSIICEIALLIIIFSQSEKETMEQNFQRKEERQS